jgi:hypothetical protein
VVAPFFGPETKTRVQPVAHGCGCPTGRTHAENEKAAENRGFFVEVIGAGEAIRTLDPTLSSEKLRSRCTVRDFSGMRESARPSGLTILK